MLRVREVGELRAQVARWRSAGDRVGFVPTMGALHEGHLSLVRRAKALVAGHQRVGSSHAATGSADRRAHEGAEWDAAEPPAAGRVIASVFVNPTQFGPGEDFDRYPRQPERDAELLAGAGCDLLFLPGVEAIYPAGHATFVVPGGAAEGLEGAHRPGHFRGVATVVCQLFGLVRPDVAVFGEKDAQQVAVVRQMVRDLHLPVEIATGPTVREADGLAMSSRNVFLSPEERRAATVLHRSLTAAGEAVRAGERRASELRRLLREVLETEPLACVDYAEVVDAGTFRPVEAVAAPVVLPLAVRIGKTRLIDNVLLAVEG